MKIVVFLCFVLMASNIPLIESNVRRKRIVGGRPAAVPPEDDPVVYIYKEDHDARVFGVRQRKGGFYVYQGIRYAYPPVGLYRFQRPRSLKLEGIINATRPPPPCPQPDPYQPRRIIGSEDCLFLNVYSSELPDGSKPGLPVLIWIHGGGYRRGSANQYGPRTIIQKNVVFVSVQYRLGSLGFLSAGAPQLSGNAGMFDMSAAVRWVQNYISFFGGDPKNIKTIGQGSGASSAMALGMSPVSSRSLTGVVAMSGSALSPNAIDPKPTEATNELAELVGCPSSPPMQLLRCLQQINIDDLIQADSRLQAFRLAEQGPLGQLGGLVSPAPVVDGRSLENGKSAGDDDRFLPWFLPEPPMKTLNESDFPAIPLLIGVCKHETGRAVQGAIKERLDHLKSNLKSISTFVDNIIGDELARIAKKAMSWTGLIGDHNILQEGLLGGLLKNPLQDRNSVPLSAASDAIGMATQRIADAANDVLFNLPAAMTSSLWSRRSPAFLYSLEHPSKQAANLGHKFLAGLPIIQSAQTATTDRTSDRTQPLVGHGDDLGLLFDSYPLEGNSDGHAEAEQSLVDEADIRLRDHFSGLIAGFAHTGSGSVPGGKDKSIWSSFSGGKSASYLVLDANPRLQNDFRACQLALWAGISQSSGSGSDGKDCHLFAHVGKAFGSVVTGIGELPGVGGTRNGSSLPLTLSRRPFSKVSRLAPRIG